ncbi:MAG: MBL fold metallo-hydrolase [Planctomycetes bacterium]|nr:MBL fold metallo-hydrolase [Planctomycetota bacterium]
MGSVMRLVVGSAVAAAPLLAAFSAPAAPALRAAVAEVAPGVFFVEAATSPHFEGANSGFVVQDQQVIVLEASMPAVARTLRAEVAARTALPIRVVFDTHDHWDHSFGNGVHAEHGALVAGSARCAELLAERGPAAFHAMAEAEDPAQREPVAGTRFVGVDLRFEERLVVGAGARRVEFLHLGRGHTRGDAVAWLPEERVLFTGDLCVNGAFNYLGDADTEHWIVVLERLQALRPKVVCPGHGAHGGPELLERQRRWLVELRAHVAAGIEAEAAPGAIAAALDLPWYREWAGVAASSRTENVASAFDELTGRRAPPLLTDDLGLVEGPSLAKSAAGWVAPRRVVVVGADESEVRRLARAVPGLRVVGAATAADAEREVELADGLIGACSAELLEKGQQLRWVQVGSAGVERFVGLPPIAQRRVTLTNAQRLYGPEIADHALGMVLSLLRGLPAARDEQRGERRWLRGDAGRGELNGRTVLVVGLGGIGREIATRSAGFGARVVATGSAPRPPSGAVERIEGPEKLHELAAIADVVFVCVPLTAATDRLCDARFFAALKPGAILCNVARGRCVDSAALLAALESGRLAGAALDVTDPEPLPPDHPLWALPQVLITPHVAADGAGAEARQFLLYRENLRRFAAGERLLSVVDPAAGY